MTILVVPEVAICTPAPLKRLSRPAKLPVAGTSTILLEKGMKQGDNVNADGVRFPAWRKISGSEFNTRAMKYLKTSEKQPSPDTLYECVALDILESSSRVTDIATKTRLMSNALASGDQKWHSPEFFIVSVAIPSEAKMGFKEKNDGKGYTLIVYSKMKSETRNILQKISSPTFDPSDKTQWSSDDERKKVNGVRLFEKWCESSPEDPEFQGRFKLVPDALNLAELGLPAWIVHYKNKPVLIKRSGITGNVYKHGNLTLEFHINFHAFPYLAKQAFAYLNDKYFKQIIANAGFIIEGRDDDELPEVIISCLQLCCPDPATSVQAADFFNGTCATSGMKAI